MVEEHSGYDIQGEIKIGGATGGIGQVVKAAGDTLIPTWGFDDYGLAFLGTVTTATSVTEFAATALTGFGNGYFVGYYVLPIWDAGAAGGAPQGEYKRISAYVTGTGTFTHTQFTAQLALTDKVLIVHPSLARSTQPVHMMSFPSATDAIVVIPAVGANLAFPSVVVDTLPAGCNIVKADMILFIGALLDTSSAENQVKTGTTDQLFVKDSGAGWAASMACLNFTALSLQVGADAYRSGCPLMGAIDIKATVTGNGTYNFQSDETTKTKGVEATGGTLELLDVSTMIRVWFS